MPAKNVKEYLDSQKIKYTAMMHSPAFTSQEVAAAAHVSGRELAKIVVVKAGDKFVLVVVPAHNKINLTKLRETLGEKTVDLASESEFKDKFTGCEVGAMPPFGHLYGMPVYISDELTKQENIMFNAGSHSELMQIAYADFEKLEKPEILT